MISIKSQISLTDLAQFYLALFIVAPVPRAPLKSEKTFRYIEQHGKPSDAMELPCWQDLYDKQKQPSWGTSDDTRPGSEPEEAEVFMSLVVPAYNEEERLGTMLKEATDYLQHAYGDSTPLIQVNGNRAKRKDATQDHLNGQVSSVKTERRGWEVLVVSDGSTDKTIETALEFAKTLTDKSVSGIRVIGLHENRGKGGAVTHGMRHVRGQYAIFADADGASKFEDLEKLVRESKKIEDSDGRSVAVGSRAHLVGSEAVVKVNLLVDCTEQELTTSPSGHSYEISSCTHFIFCFVYSHLRLQQRFEIPSADSNYSQDHHYVTLSHSCIPKAGYLMSRC